ncbi:22331_t:CDS:2 [Dentiscutata erythropus]|uniref:22331_t:CDS:1 n=1 Tax=Dentiscutata erythropus TaxID=1348616 RepID=A0A9N9AHJ5_9GLOM|nr:22331_t:CDS:2 [Dentiscutata erythropus]
MAVTTVQIMGESEMNFNPHNDEPLKHEHMISQNDVKYEECFELYINDMLTIKSFAVSDNKLVSMPIYGDEDGLIKKIGVFDFLGLPYSSYLLIYLNFLEDNDLVAIVDSLIGSFNGYKIYVFTQKKNRLIRKSTIKLDIKPHQIFMSPKGKLFIYDNDIGNITKWDIKTLKFEAHFLVKPFTDIDIKLSDNGLFLLVYAVRYVAKRMVDSSIFIFLAENGMKFTSYNWGGLEIYAFDLIASEFCARLLIMAKNKEKQNINHIVDPFISSEKVDANKLLSYSETSDVQKQFQYPCIIKFDNVIGSIGKSLVTKKLIPDERNWIPYLRNTLEDSNRIYMSSIRKNVAEFIEPFIDKYTLKTDNDNNIPEVKPINKVFEKYLVKWTLHCDKNFDIIKAESKDASDEVNFRPNYHNSPTTFAIEAFCLDNDDLVIYGELCLLIWTFSAKKKIQMIYCWHINPNDHSIIKSLSSNSLNSKGYFLPAPSESFIKRISFYQPDMTIRYLIEELLDEYIRNEYFLILYGDELMKFFIDNGKDVQLRRLCNRCIKLVFESDESPPNIQLFRIISQSLTKISERNPTYFDDFIIRISFLCVFDRSYLESTLEDKIRLKHLHHYGSYNGIIDILMKN